MSEQITKKIFAIDPGNENSAYVIIESDTCKPLKFGKIPNEELKKLLLSAECADIEEFAIERVASYGMPVGREVFETCEWVGKYSEVIELVHKKRASYVYRKEESKHICCSPTAGDSNIRRALIDMFAKHDMKNGKGTKKNPDFFYGFAADVWAAFAVAVTHIEKKKLSRV